MSQHYSEFIEESHLYGANAAYIEELYESYLKDPASVSAHWQQYFERLGKHQTSSENKALPVSGKAEQANQVDQSAEKAEKIDKSGAVAQLVNAYRSNGVLNARIDPLKLNVLNPHRVSELDPSYHGLTDADMEMLVDTTGTYFPASRMTLQELLDMLKKAYCGTLAAEYMYIRDTSIRNWWAQRLEALPYLPAFDAQQKKHLLERMTAAEEFENYLNTRYVGVKRFSLGGGETFIVAMDELVRYASQKGVDEIVMGMAHRGRLNALVNTLGKPPHDLFAEFDGTAEQTLSSGDVKYHNGFSNNLKTPHGTVHICMAYNPSHLEAVSSVQSGSARARIDRRMNPKADTVLAVTVHGDGAVIGQGIVQEVFSLAGTRGYTVGGSIRIVINNQVQFTTSDLRDVRTSIYCTDIARMTDMPVLHVNGDDPEAVARAVRLAVDFRQEFQRDVMLDIICYRKLGHNEQDTPQITQPHMYKAIKDHAGSRHLYAQQLIAEGIATQAEAEQYIQDYRQRLEKNETVSLPINASYQYPHINNWKLYLGKPWVEPILTGVAVADLKQFIKALTTVPASVRVHPLVQRVLDDRAAMRKDDATVDWGMAENLAYASLVKEGIPVRLSGEDCGRGTFSHRQCIVHDQNRENRFDDAYIPLQNISKNQASFVAIDSVLSENAVLGFEYGYSISRPHGLTLWEAQFGDFANGAQIIIDQFISSGETKWGQHSGVVLLLPHGYEGQGPEHSSARIERFLELSAEDNWVLAQPTTAAQIFHLLRLQALAPYRKPLVVFTPKSLLRHKKSMVPLSALTTGQFQMVIGDEKAKANTVKRVILCSGKVYFDLLATREEKKLQDDVAIIRVEQLYPFPAQALSRELKQYLYAKEVIWCQDEPENQGGWNYLYPQLQALLNGRQSLGLACRPACSAPATGYASKHTQQSTALMYAAFGKPNKIFE